MKAKESMKAKDLVGKLVTSNYLESRRIFPPAQRSRLWDMNAI